MKKTVLSSIFLFTAFFSVNAAAISDTVSTGAGYSNEIYYSIPNKTKLALPIKEWDLAFEVGNLPNGFGFTIRTNDGVGTKLFPWAAISDWASIDTTGLSTKTTLINSDTSWVNGAFNNHAVQNQFDVGWGIYNPANHIVSGDSVYVVQLSNGEYKKLSILSLNAGNYTFKHANIDGSNEITKTIKKINYPNKNFVYYSIITDQIIDREPKVTDWDLLFTKYTSQIGMQGTYPVSGILHNHSIEVAEISGTAPSNVSWQNQTTSKEINTIGYDWKSFNMSTGGYDILNDRTYFIKTPAGIYKMILTGFDGSSTGNYYFTIENISLQNAIEENNITILAAYPNPANNNITLTFDANSDKKVNYKIFATTGKMVKEGNFVINSGLGQQIIGTSDINNGSYFIQTITNTGIQTIPVTIQH